MTSPSRTIAAALANAVAPYDLHTAAELARLVYDIHHTDPGPLCLRCRRPYREWYGCPACECGEDGEP